MIYFDNAATSFPKPSFVVSATLNALKENSANPGRSGHKMSVKTAEKIYFCRKAIADFFVAGDAENVIFTQNCTHSLNNVIKGFLKNGDHVVISNLEHNAVMRPVYSLGSQGVITFDIFEAFNLSDDEIIKNFKSSITPKTKLCVCTGASNVTGQVLPIRKIGEVCKEKGIAFCVDGAQISGSGTVNMEADNIDFLCIAPHKSLFAPMGIGVLIAQKPIENVLIEGGTGGNSAAHTVPDFYPERMESGTVNVPGIMGVNAGLNYLKSKGAERLYEGEILLLQKLYKGLKNNSNVKLYTPFPEKKKFMPLLPFNLKGCESEKTAAVLDDFGVATRAGLHCAPMAHKALGTLFDGAVRVSVGAFNNEAEVDYLINLLKSKNFLKKL